MLTSSREEAILGCLLGSAVGDALGLWCEGMTPRRQKRWQADLTRYHFLGGKGMISDDTEHLCMTAQALIVSAGNPEKFQKSLAWRLRFWLLGLPAGIGKATARALIKLWLGGRRGVFSAGNGPAMRSTILGVCLGQDPDLLRDFVSRSTQLTHTDPKAVNGALAVAWAAHVNSTMSGEKEISDQFVSGLKVLLRGEEQEFLGLVNQTMISAGAGQETEDFARALGLGSKGVTGYMYHTVPVVLQAWLRYPYDIRTAMTALLRCGGDTDTMGAILGGIMGAGVGKRGLPPAWLTDLWDWPRSVTWIERLGKRLAEPTATGKARKALPLFIPGMLLRNLFFLLIVLFHGLRRLLPPY